MSQTSKKTPASKDSKSAGTRSASLRPGGSPAKFDDSPDMISSRKKVDTYEKAYALLRSRDWIPEEDRPSLDSMTSGLLHLAGHASAPVREALCAFATYAKSISDDQTSNALLAKLGPTIDKIAVATRTWSEEVEDEDQRKATELEGVMGRLVTEVSKLSDSQSRLAKEMESMGRMRTEFEEVMQKAATAAAAAPPPADHRQWGEPPEDGEIRGSDPRRSYADMARRQLPREHAPTIARQERNARQVLVDVKSRADAEGNPLTEQELVEKANRALELMTKDPATFPEGERFVAVSKLKEGGLLYETSNASMAKWLLKTDNMTAFTKGFGYEAVIRERGYLVFFRNVPAYFQPSEQAYRALERENDWASRSLMTCHWIKPVDKRKQGQMTAHMLAKFRTLKAANAALIYGATVLGRKIKTEKQPKEARRCLKCQKYEPNHLAAHCRGDETCGTCASTEHKTQPCVLGQAVPDVHSG
ncbi:hypothetical protein EVJ58_g2264 [Rhodofomes roseus]|uniref:Uncharacterized protein n=2 Tax=Rhodofomes roseus TaxID=34475 RepID=A0A4Y9YRH3_9APHY|nr:hypothetical protein EVJ58_g2264 [Rhodofomes roseus]